MSKRINWNIPVPKVLDDALEQAVKEKSIYSNKSDFVRDAVRRRLEELGYKPQTFNQKISEEGGTYAC
jgi:Arc/MetJ-type ribon-helix-helix transcriptional regulator